MFGYGFREVIKSVYTAPKTQDIINQIPWSSVQSDLFCIDPCCLLFEIGDKGRLAPHSFLPQIKLILSGNNSGVQISVEVKLKASARVFLSVFTVMAIVIQIVLIVLWIRDELSFMLLCFLPSMMVVFAHFMSYCGMKCSTRHFMRELRNAISNSF